MFIKGNCHWRRQCFKYHPVFGWWHVPNLRARIPLGGTFHLFESNSIGMRASRNYLHRSPAGISRIVALGDSYTAGDGVSNAQRYSDLLEHDHEGLEVLNFGLNGSGTDQQVLIFENIARHFETDAYLFGICVENIARNLCSCRPSMAWNETQAYFRPKPYFTCNNDGLELHHVPVPKQRRPQDEMGDWACSFPYVSEHPTDTYAIYRYPESEHWQMMRRILRRFLDAVAGTPVLLVPLPMYDHYLEAAPPTYLERFRELAGEVDNCHVVDVLPKLTQRPLAERDIYRFPEDPHYTAAAHRAVADAISAALPGLVCPH